MAREQTYQQQKRQQERKRNGQYRKMPPCEVCGKVVGSNYYTDSRQSLALGVHGLVLCGRCCNRIAGMSDTEALAQFHQHIPACTCSVVSNLAE